MAFAHFFERPSIEKGFDMVIQSLVVDVTLRGSGIGRLLMERIEHVARSNNCDTVVLSSQASRNDAHGFYKRLGYEVGTTSNVFLKRTRVATGRCLMSVNGTKRTSHLDRRMSAIRGKADSHPIRVASCVTFSPLPLD